MTHQPDTRPRPRRTHARCVRPPRPLRHLRRPPRRPRSRRPVIGDHDVLVEVRAAGLDRGTEHLMTGKPYAMRLAIRTPTPEEPGARPRRRRHRRGRSDARSPGSRSATRCTASHRDPSPSTRWPARPSSPASRRTSRSPQAAVVPVSAATALRALVDVGRVQPGQSVLVHRRLRRRRQLRRPAGEGVRSRGHRASAAPARPTWSPHSGPTTSSTTPARTSPTERAPTTSCSTSPATPR